MPLKNGIRLNASCAQNACLLKCKRGITSADGTTFAARPVEIPGTGAMIAGILYGGKALKSIKANCRSGARLTVDNYFIHNGGSGSLYITEYGYSFAGKSINPMYIPHLPWLAYSS